MKQRLKKGCLICVGFVMLACQDATIDYASDIVGIYMVETAVIDGVTTDYSNLPLEDAWIMDISQDNLLSYENAINQCDTTYRQEARIIESITDTSIVFEDGTRIYYTISVDQLTLVNNDDVITLVEYGSDFPPPSWTDPSQLTNDIYEPDDSLSQATRIAAAGSRQSHYSAICDDEDFFIFEALASTIYVIEAKAENGSDIDLTISLFSENGIMVDYNDDQTTTNVDPKLTWTCPVSGDYYFIIKKYWDYLDPGNSADDEKGAYTVSVDVTKNFMGVSHADVIKLQPPRHPTNPRAFFK